MRREGWREGVQTRDVSTCQSADYPILSEDMGYGGRDGTDCPGGIGGGGGGGVIGTGLCTWELGSQTKSAIR